jgi:hypothetical protein
VSKPLWTDFLALWWGFAVLAASAADHADHVASLIDPAELATARRAGVQGSASGSPTSVR